MCDRDEWDWCMYHDVPFVQIRTEWLCASQIGQTPDMAANAPLARMRGRALEWSNEVDEARGQIADEREYCRNNHHDEDDCDHSNCADWDDVYAKEDAVLNEDVAVLLDQIERGTFDPLDLQDWRRRIGA